MHENWARQNLFPSLFEREQNSNFCRNRWKDLGSTNLFRLNSISDEVKAFYGLAKGSFDLPFCLSAVAQNIAIKLLKNYGTEKQKARFLSYAEDGTFIVAVANSEESGGTDVKSISSYLKANGNKGALRLQKRGASNLSDADLILASAWKIIDDKKTSLEVFLVEKHQVQQTSHNDKLLGFKTGQTGALITHEDLKVTIEDVQLGVDKSGFLILKECFHLERLFVPTIICGMIDGLVDVALAKLATKTSFGKSLLEYQYIQEKIYRIYRAKTILWGIIQQISTSNNDLGHFNKELAVLKSCAIEEGLDACLSFFESLGYEAYVDSSLASKLIRDILAFKFLGGSVEQQKMVFFQDISQRK